MNQTSRSPRVWCRKARNNRNNKKPHTAELISDYSQTVIHVFHVLRITLKSENASRTRYCAWKVSVETDTRLVRSSVSSGLHTHSRALLPEWWVHRPNSILHLHCQCPRRLKRQQGLLNTVSEIKPMDVIELGLYLARSRQQGPGIQVQS